MEKEQRFIDHSLSLLLILFTLFIFNFEQASANKEGYDYSLASVHLSYYSSPQFLEEEAVNCTYPNDCQYVRGKPYCYQGICRQCDPSFSVPECLCPPGSYCVSYPSSSLLGSCKKFEENIIGRMCANNLKDRGMTLVNGYNDSLFCGNVIYGSDLNAEWVEWEGSCILGICKECSISPIPTLPIAYCPDGRSCSRDGKLMYSPYGILSLNFLPHNPTLLVAYILFYCCIFFSISMIAGVLFTVFYLHYYQKLPFL